MLQLTGHRLQLLILSDLLLDLLLELALHRLDSLNTLLSVDSQLLSLLIQALLIVLFLLHVLTLNDLLGLLGDSVKLNVFGALYEVLNLQL